MIETALVLPLWWEWQANIHRLYSLCPQDRYKQIPHVAEAPCGIKNQVCSLFSPPVFCLFANFSPKCKIAQNLSELYAFGEILGDSFRYERFSLRRQYTFRRLFLTLLSCLKSIDF
nr:MAG TPA: hypothetical protein [Caudoviricetes sp.]